MVIVIPPIAHPITPWGLASHAALTGEVCVSTRASRGHGPAIGKLFCSRYAPSELPWRRVDADSPNMGVGEHVRARGQAKRTKVDYSGISDKSGVADSITSSHSCHGFATISGHTALLAQSCHSMTTCWVDNQSYSCHAHHLYHEIPN